MRKTMTALEMAKELQARGYNVTVVNRTEGKAIRISSINGKRFIGSKGNIEARKLLGVCLTASQERHIEKIASAQKKGVFGRARKEPLPADFIRLQNKANKAFREIGQTARVTRAKIRYRLKEYGEDETRAYLERVVKYAKGFAHTESLEAYYQRLEQNYSKTDSFDVKAVMDRVRVIIDTGLSLREPLFEELLDLTYTWEQTRGTPMAMNDSTFRHRALLILSKAE